MWFCIRQCIFFFLTFTYLTRHGFIFHRKKKRLKFKRYIWIVALRPCCAWCESCWDFYAWSDCIQRLPVGSCVRCTMWGCDWCSDFYWWASLKRRHPAIFQCCINSIHSGIFSESARSFWPFCFDAFRAGGKFGCFLWLCLCAHERNLGVFSVWWCYCTERGRSDLTRGHVFVVLFFQKKSWLLFVFYQELSEGKRMWQVPKKIDEMEHVLILCNTTWKNTLKIDASHQICMEDSNSLHKK